MNKEVELALLRLKIHELRIEVKDLSHEKTQMENLMSYETLEKNGFKEAAKKYKKNFLKNKRVGIFHQKTKLVEKVKKDAK